MKVLIDNQIFENQRFGGISRYFNELQASNAIQKMDLFIKKNPQKHLFYQRVQRKLERVVLNKSRKTPDKYDFYKSQMETLEYDIFHPTYYDNYFLEKLKKPFVLTVYDMIHEKFAEYFGSSHDSINKRNLCEAANKIIAISHSTKKDLIEIFELPEDKIEVIHLATNYASIDSIKPNLVFNDYRYILFTGNRTIYKNFLTFLIAIAPILKSNDDLILVCTGPAFSIIESGWIKDLGVNNKVISHYCINDNELVYLYQNAECFVFPSLYEGFGFPVLEAFACDCPLVTSPGGSLKEIAQDAAVYFDPKNIREIRQSIENVISDNTLRKDLIVAGRKRLKDFSWDKCRKETLKLYSEVV